MKFSDFPQYVIKENVDYTVKEITNVIKKYGPRESGNENCFAAEKHLKKELDMFTDESHFEEYKMAPKAFLMFTKFVGSIIILTFVVCAMLTFTNVVDGFLIPIAIMTVVIFLGLFVTAMEFLLYKQFCDPFHKKITAHNLVATRKPTGEVKRRIIISGHIDAAYEWRHIYLFKQYGMSVLMTGTISVSIVAFLMGVITIILNLSGVDNSFYNFLINYGYYFYSVVALFMISLICFVDFKTISPGANDNLTGTYAAVCAMKMLEEANVQFENTEVVCMINDGEEAGLRGAKAYAKAHNEMLTDQEVETVVLCVDTLTDLEYLNVYNKDMTGLVKNDSAFSKLVMDAAHDAEHTDLKYSSVYFGASDAAAFSQAGIKATCLAAMDPAPADYYHNRRDTAERLNPEAIKTGFEVVMSTILKYDEEGLSK